MVPLATIGQVAERPWVRLLLIFIYLGAAVTEITLLLRYALPGPAGPPESALDNVIFWELAMAIVAVGGLFLFFRGLLRRRPGDFGFPLSKIGTPLRQGFVLGGVLIGLVVTIMSLSGNYRARIRTPATGAGLIWTLFQELALFFFGAIFEETALRGLVFQTLEEWLGSWIAIGISALVF